MPARPAPRPARRPARPAAGRPVRQPAARPVPGAPARAWGPAEVVGGFLGGVLLSALVAGAVIDAGGWDATERTGDGAALGRTVMQVATGAEIGSRLPPFVVSTLLIVPLWVGLVAAVVVARRRGASTADLRLAGRPVDLLGLPVGVVTQLVVVPLLYLPVLLWFEDLDVSGPARELTERASGWGVVVLVVVVGLGAPVVEELFYRGLVLRTFEDRFGARTGLVASSLLFGLAHLQALQFPALVVFGLVAGVLAQRTGRLLAPIAAHVGFNAATLVVLLAWD